MIHTICYELLFNQMCWINLDIWKEDLGVLDN
jgi:hypothetical protein